MKIILQGANLEICSIYTLMLSILVTIIKGVFILLKAVYFVLYLLSVVKLVDIFVEIDLYVKFL